MSRARIPPESLWDANAAAYSSAQDKNALKEIYVRSVFKAIGSVKGLNVLDAGCGDGRYSCALVKRGASVVGLDSSPNFVNIARTSYQSGQLQFLIGNLT